MDMVARVKGILLNPKAEWPVIEREPGDFGSLFRNYVLFVAAVPPVCMFVGSALLDLGPVRFTMLGGLMLAVITYVCAIVGVVIMAWIIDGLAGMFGAPRNADNARRIAAYAPTAAWLVGIFNLIPFLGILSILGLYSFYLLHTGIVALMRPPAEKAVLYTVVAVICVLVLWAVLVWVPFALLAL